MLCIFTINKICTCCISLDATVESQNPDRSCTQEVAYKNQLHSTYSITVMHYHGLTTTSKNYPKLTLQRMGLHAVKVVSECNHLVGIGHTHTHTQHMTIGSGPTIDRLAHQEKPGRMTTRLGILLTLQNKTTHIYLWQVYQFHAAQICEAIKWVLHHRNTVATRWRVQTVILTALKRSEMQITDITFCDYYGQLNTKLTIHCLASVHWRWPHFCRTRVHHLYVHCSHTEHALSPMTRIRWPRYILMHS